MWMGLKLTPSLHHIMYFIIHQKVIGGRLFCFAQIEIWRAFPGTIEVRRIPNGYYIGKEN